MNPVFVSAALGLSLGVASWAAQDSDSARTSHADHDSRVPIGDERPAARNLAVKIVPEVYPFSRLDELVQFSDTILVGRVTEVVEVANPDGLPHIEHTIAVEQALAGGESGPCKVLVTGGRGNGYHVAVEGAPQLLRGEQYLFFLREVAGAYSLVGLSSGVYPLRDWDASGGGTIAGAHAPGGTDAVEFIGAVVDILVQQEAQGLRSR